jgi:hypothetical protein
MDLRDNFVNNRLQPSRMTLMVQRLVCNISLQFVTLQYLTLQLYAKNAALILWHSPPVTYHSPYF